jgi:hypothetical protein
MEKPTCPICLQKLSISEVEWHIQKCLKYKNTCFGLDIIDIEDVEPQVKKQKIESKSTITNDTDLSKCCVPLHKHKDSKYKNTQTSIRIVYGKTAIKVCDYNHWKDCYELIESNLNLVKDVSTSPTNNEIGEKCCNKICAKGKIF